MSRNSASAIGEGSLHEDFARDAAAGTGRGVGRASAPVCRLFSSVLGRLAIALAFFLIIVPLGLVMRALGLDPLRLRREPAAASYWIARDPPGPAPATMKNQS